MTTFNVDGREVAIEVDAHALYIHLEGCGTAAKANGWPIQIDWYYDEPTIYVWADIEQEDTTHKISMRGALESESV